MARIFKNKKIIFIPLLSAAILLFLSCSVFLTQRVSANGPIELKEICDDPKPAATSTSFSSLANKIFRFSIVAAALLGVIMITIGGFMYVAAAGSTSTITKAKDMIWNAIIGLIIVISSVFILWTINPDLVSMKLPIPEVKIEPIPTATTTTYVWTLVDFNQRCKDVLGDNWKDVDANHCPGSAPSMKHNCCGYFPTIEPPNADPSKTHTECLLEGFTKETTSYQCVSVLGEGRNECTDNQSCRKKLNCCACDYYVYSNCTSGMNITTEESCYNKCSSFFAPRWRYNFKESAMCDENKQCVAQ